MNKYIPTIGVEVHVELKTNTKIFSASKNGYGSSANSLTNVIDLGYPGTLPTLNEEVINVGIKAATLLNCKIRREMHFDRKNYFYPDNAKNYQITQARTPIGYDGYVEKEYDGIKKKIEIEEMHLEEDTCKSTHRKDKTLLDFNRAGVPLLEIVTKPCISNSLEAKLYLEKLKKLLFYADVSDCKMEEGSMRADANVSLRLNESDPFGTKVEIKNIGSISSVGEAIEKEIVRQTNMLDRGETFKEQTRRYDDKLGDTVLMRVKETGNDYRYFPEPDIPYIDLTDEYIKETKDNLPMSAEERREVYRKAGINNVNVEKIIQNRTISDYIDKFDNKINLVIASNLLLGDIAAYLNKTEMTIEQTSLTDEKFETIVKYLDNGKINSKIFKDILDDVMETSDDIDKILDLHGIKQMGEEEVISIINSVIDNNPQSVEDYRNGNERAIKFLMGQIMKETKGNANPQMITQKLTELLNK